jgi:hypothetical protein
MAGQCAIKQPGNCSGKAQAMATVSLLDVQAQWGYSEIVDSNFQTRYDNGYDITELRAKRQRGMPYTDLAGADRYNLAFQCFMAKTHLMVYLTSIDTFELINLGRDQLATLLVPLTVSGVCRFLTFEDCLKMPSPILVPLAMWYATPQPIGLQLIHFTTTFLGWH